MPASLSIEKLRSAHNVDEFDCGQEALNRYLSRYALISQLSNISQTYVGLSGHTVIGFYTLTVGQVSAQDTPARLSKGLPRHPIPLMLLARLGVSKDWQKKGVGAGLLKDALLRTLKASEITGIRALAVHAKDDKARAFYAHFDFLPSPTDPYHLYLLMKDVRRAVGE